MGALRFLVLCVLYGAAAWVSTAAEASRGVAQVREYRRANEHRIVHELVDLLAIPNVATDTPNIQRNAAKLVEMLERRGISARLLPIEGRGPVVFGELEAPGATRTVIFYCHYDGQPVDPSRWIDTTPFQPALRTNSIEAGGKLIPFPERPAPYQDDFCLSGCFS